MLLECAVLIMESSSELGHSRMMLNHTRIFFCSPSLATERLLHIKPVIAVRHCIALIIAAEQLQHASCKAKHFGMGHKDDRHDMA